MKLEIERKFLLKSVPDIKPVEIIKIEQFYFKNSKGIWERARSWHSDKNGMKYIHTVKKSVSKGVNLEDEYYMTSEQFQEFKNHCFSCDEYRHISKERWVYPDGALFWEVDVFNSGYNLIIAEIEIPIKSYKLTIPDFIKDKMLLEVTEMKQFSNRSLSKKIINKV